MAKYAPAWMRIATNKRTKPLTSAQSYAIERAKMIPTVSDVIADGRRAIAGDESNIGPVIDEAIARARAYLEAA
jgi:hypothetical protein